MIVIPLAMLFVTGVYIGHFAALSPWFKATTVPQSALPPAYALHNWNDWIEAIAAYPGQPERLSLGTRIGLFTTDDNGRTWHTETSVTGGVLRLRRVGDELLAHDQCHLVGLERRVERRVDGAVVGDRDEVEAAPGVLGVPRDERRVGGP